MSNLTLPVIGIYRHRLTIDGEGVTTLVASYGCPLKCQYCLNPQSWNPETLKKSKSLSPEELYEKVKIDDLYFAATGGGITFGGGESLLHAEFIREFRKICGFRWKLNVESSLNVKREQLEMVLGVVDEYIIDIKDMNSEIYEAYTGKDNSQVLENLRILSENVNPQSVTIRIPLIKGYNTQKEIDSSILAVKTMGFTKLDVFTYIVDKKKK